MPPEAFADYCIWTITRLNTHEPIAHECIYDSYHRVAYTYIAKATATDMYDILVYSCSYATEFNLNACIASFSDQ